MRRCNRTVLIFATAFVVAILNTGCAGTEIVVGEPPPPVVCTQLPNVDIINLVDTPPTLVALEPFTLQGTPPLWLPNQNATYGYWFSSDLYASLAENLQQMRKNASQLRAVGRYYRACIQDHNAALAAEDDNGKPEQ